MKRQEDDADLDLSHAIEFFEVAHRMHEFMATICNKSLDSKWEEYLDSFKNAAKEFLRPCQHIGLQNNFHFQQNQQLLSDQYFRNFVPARLGAFERFHYQNQPKSWFSVQRSGLPT